MAAALDGLRVLERSTGVAARTTGMLLADLGAEVVRVLPAPVRPRGPEDVARDRGKRYVPAGDEAGVDALEAAAEVVIDELTTDSSGATDASGAAEPPVRLHMPPYGSRGSSRMLPPDAVLLGARSGFAVQMPSTRPGSPVATVLPMVESLQGAIGAAVALAGVWGARHTGRSRRFEVNGLHAAAAALVPIAVEGLDVERVHSSGGRVPGLPNFRAYRCGDGLFLHLAALTADFFLPALTVLDRMELMVLPGVDGEFTQLLIPEHGDAVGRELERTFATRPRDEWLADLAQAGVPAAPVRPREEWLRGEIVAAAAPPVTCLDAELGEVVLPGPAVRFAANPVTVGPLADPAAGAPAWTGRRAATAGERSAAGVGPLADLRVVDLSTFLAAPFVGSLLADLGAAVVKVETPRGDPYSVFTAGYAGVNQAKTIGALDLRGEPGHTALLGLLGEADVLVDNLRPAVAERLGLSDAVLAEAGGPGLVRASVSAFGRGGPFADLPGFDPVLQALSGMSAAQGGPDDPVATSSPVIDVATGALTAVGVLAALLARERTGRGDHVTTSLAATSTFLQLAELVSYRGRPTPRLGGRDHRGPTAAHRFHEAADGWLAVAATTAEQRDALAGVLGLPAGSLTGCGRGAAAVEAAFQTRSVADWLAGLAAAGVPATSVVPRVGGLHDPDLVAEEVTHVVQDPRLGRFRLSRGYHHDRDRGSTRVVTPWPAAERALAEAGTPAAPFVVVPG